MKSSDKGLRDMTLGMRGESPRQRGTTRCVTRNAYAAFVTA